MPDLPEQQARANIDAMLAAAGWAVQDYKAFNPSVSTGIALCEVPLKSGRCDYLLLVNRRPVGVVEAKKEGVTLSTVAEQSAHYAKNLPDFLATGLGPEGLPFRYESTGVETFFRDERDPHPRPRRVFNFHRPETLAQWITSAKTLRALLGEMAFTHPLNTLGMRDCQIEGITGLEQSLASDHPRALIQMATGSGKTFTACAFTYRLIKFAKARRVLFLVDRANLGRQAKTEFDQYVLPDDGRKFTAVYNVQHLTSNKLDDVCRVTICTIQRLYSMLRGEHGLGEALGVGAAVKDLERGDFDLMLLDVVAERLGQGGGFVLGCGAEALLDDFINDGGGDGLLAVLLHFGEQFAQGWILEGGAGGGDEFGLSLGEGFLAELLRLGPFDAGGVLGDGIGIEGRQERLGHLAEAVTATGGGDFLLLRGGEFAVEPGEASGEGGEAVFIPLPQGDAEHEGGEGDGGLALQRAGLGLVALADADGIDDDEVGLGLGLGPGDGLQIRGREHAGAAAFHLLEVNAAADIAKEEQALQRLDVGAGGDHVHRDGDAELRGGAELGDEVFAFGGLAGGGVLGLIGDLFAEVGAFAKDLPDEMHDVLGMAVVLGEDERLGHEGATGEELGEEGIPISGEHGADLGGDDDAAVQLLVREGEIFIQALPAAAAGLFVPTVHVEAFLDFVALLGDAGLDAIDLVADIHAIGDGALVAVFHDEVLAEKADGLL